MPPRHTVPARPGADPDRLFPLAALAQRMWFLENDLALLPHVVPVGATCIDVGANRGIYTVACALLTGRTGRVVGLEPQPGPLRTARALRTALRLHHVELHETAVSDEPGRLSLVVPTRFGLPVYGRAFLADAPRLSTEDLSEFHGHRRRDVQVTTLDTLVDALGMERLDFLKADVEGAELRMLNGATATVERHRPVVLLEIEDRHVRKYGHGAADVMGWFVERGYTAHVLLRNGRPHRGPQAAGANGRGPRPRAPRGTVVQVERVTPDARNYLLLPD